MVCTMAMTENDWAFKEQTNFLAQETRKSYLENRLNRQVCQALGKHFFSLFSVLGTFLKSITGVNNEINHQIRRIFSNDA